MDKDIRQRIKEMMERNAGATAVAVARGPGAVAVAEAEGGQARAEAGPGEVVIDLYRRR